MNTLLEWADGITGNMSTSEVTNLFFSLLLSLILNLGLILIIGLRCNT